MRVRREFIHGLMKILLIIVKKLVVVNNEFFYWVWNVGKEIKN